MIVAAGGGERDIAVDNAILAGVRKANQPGVFLNERLMSDLRPTLFLAQLPNLLAGNISLVHGVVGSSRTFMGEESAGVDAVRVAQARIAAGQSELTLVGGAYNGARWDVLLAFELGHVLLQGQIRASVGSRPAGRHCLCDDGRLHGAGKPGARESTRRQAASAAFGGLFRSQRAQPGESEAALLGQWQAHRRPGRSGACRYHLRRHRARTGNLGGAPRARGNWASDSQYRYVYRAWGRQPIYRQSGYRLRGNRARQAVCAGRQRRLGRKPARICRKSSSPASAIGAAKDWHWSNGSTEGETSWHLIGGAETRQSRPSHRRHHRHRRRHLARRRQDRQLGETDPPASPASAASPVFRPTDCEPRSPARSTTSTKTTCRLLN